MIEPFQLGSFPKLSLTAAACSTVSYSINATLRTETSLIPLNPSPLNSSSISVSMVPFGIF